MKNKVVLLTGSSGRIGSAIARHLLKNGFKVVLADVKIDLLDSLLEEFHSDSYINTYCDITNIDSIDSCIQIGKEKFKKIDWAIHCAYPRSDNWGRNFENLSYEDLSTDLSAHLGGSIIFSQRILSFFRDQGYGNLIHFSSIMGVATPKFENYVGTEMTSPIEYTAIKSAVISITKYLAKYFKGNNIRVNCISPGGILDNQPTLFLEKYKDCCNDKGMLDAEDILGTVTFLLGDESKYINGQNLIVDDGWIL